MITSHRWVVSNFAAVMKIYSSNGASGPEPRIARYVVPNRWGKWSALSLCSAILFWLYTFNRSWFTDIINRLCCVKYALTESSILPCKIWETLCKKSNHFGRSCGLVEIYSCTGSEVGRSSCRAGLCNLSVTAGCTHQRMMNSQYSVWCRGHSRV